MYYSESAKVIDFKIFRLKSSVKLSWSCHLFTQLYFSPVKKKLFFYFFFLAVLQSMWDLSSLTRVQTYTPCSGWAESQALDCWESPRFSPIFNLPPSLPSFLSFSTQHEISMNYRPITMLMAWDTLMCSNWQYLISWMCRWGRVALTRQSKGAYQGG